jgi:hypothetical protein
LRFQGVRLKFDDVMNHILKLYITFELSCEKKVIKGDVVFATLLILARCMNTIFPWITFVFLLFI